MEQTVRILVNCPDCSEVKVPASEITLRVCIDDVHWAYWFLCPKCDLRAAGSTSQRAALDAISAGSRLDSWRLPAELSEAHDGPPFELDDLLELRLELARRDLIENLAHDI